MAHVFGDGTNNVKMEMKNFHEFPIILNDFMKIQLNSYKFRLEISIIPNKYFDVAAFVSIAGS